jgi:hypothetical protein
LPPRPERSVPLFFRRIALATVFPDDFEYLRPDDFRPDDLRPEELRPDDFFFLGMWFPS